MSKCLFETFKYFEGQPVKIYTDDGRVYKGIDINALDGAVRIIDKCGRLILIEYCHIDAVEEPQLALHGCRDFFGDGNGNDDDDDCGRKKYNS